MVAKPMTRRALVCLAAALGFGLVLTAQGQAQPGGKGKGFDKKFDRPEKGFDRKPFDSRDERGRDERRDDRGPGARTSVETERLQAQIKSLNAKLESLTAQLRELKAKSGKGTMSARTGPEKGRKEGPMTAKGIGGFGKGPMAKGDKGSPWMQGGGFGKGGPPWMRGGFDRKGPQSFGRDMRGPDRRDYGRDDRRGPQTSARDGRDRGRPSMDRGPQRGPQARGPERRPEQGRGGSLESRLDRLIGELEALKREVRNRR